MKKSAELHVALGTPHDFVEIHKFKFTPKGAWLNIRICKECLYMEYAWLATNKWQEFTWSQKAKPGFYSARFILSRYLSYEKFLDSHGDDFI